MVLNATFNNISCISWQSVEETWVSGENHRPIASHWQTLSHIVISSTSCLSEVLNQKLEQFENFLLESDSFLQNKILPFLKHYICIYVCNSFFLWNEVKTSSFNLSFSFIRVWTSCVKGREVQCIHADCTDLLEFSRIYIWLTPHLGVANVSVTLDPQVLLLVEKY